MSVCRGVNLTLFPGEMGITWSVGTEGIPGYYSGTCNLIYLRCVAFPHDVIVAVATETWNSWYREVRT